MVALSSLPQHWCLVCLSDIFSWSNGKGLTKKKMLGGEHLVYGGNGIAGSHTDWLCESKSIVIGRVGAQCGNVHCAPPRTWITDNAIYSSAVSTSVDLDYFYYLLKNEKLNELAGGSGQPYVSQELLNSLDVPLPPLNEQHRIVTKIEAITTRSRKAREALDAIPALLDQFRQSVLAAAFRGDLTADWRAQNPDVEPAEKLLELFSAEREAEYKTQKVKLQSENTRVPKLPPIQKYQLSNNLPESWVSISVESASSFIVDCLHSTPKFTQEGEYCIDTTCIEPSVINWEVARKVSKEDFIKRTSRLRPEAGDIIFSREGTIGTAVRVPEDKPICLGQRMMMFRFCSLILPEFAEIYLRSPQFKSQCEPLITGTTSPHINIGEIRKLVFLIPSVAEQIELVNQVSKYLIVCEQISDIYKDSDDELGQLDQSILAKAFRGQLVPQGPTDEPASVLLQRIQAEREKLNANSKKKKTRAKKKK